MCEETDPGPWSKGETHAVNFLVNLTEEDGIKERFFCSVSIFI